MHLQRLILLLVGGILLGLTVSSVDAKPGPVKRFSIKKKAPPSPKFETKAQKYARELTTRKPTRRSTAMRRQTSPIPTVSATIGATDEFGTSIGSLVYREQTIEWAVSSDDTPAILIVPQAGFSATSTSRVQTVGGASQFYVLQKFY
uniref:Uncharacterized protein n=1 Tax=Psilocybe cubensis TaxID=181762 RepID=A0A8H8CM49_PSICU